MSDTFIDVRQTVLAEAAVHMEAADDILDFLDGGSLGDHPAIVSAIIAQTHATLALARYTQANGVR